MTLMRQPVSLIVIAVLALVQAVLGVLRALDWFSAGVDLSGQGIILLPLAGAIAFARGGLIAVIASLYFLFALGAFMGRRWAWWLGLSAALINLLMVYSALVQGESLVRALPWIVVPVILVAYLLAPAGRRALRH